MGLFKVIIKGKPNEKAMVVGNTIASIIDQSAAKLTVGREKPLRIVLEVDGTPIDDDAVLEALGNISSVKDVCVLVLLKEGEEFETTVGDGSPILPSSSRGATEQPVAPNPTTPVARTGAHLVPWQKLPSALLRDCDRDLVPTNPDRLQMIRVISDHLVHEVKDKRRSICKKVADLIVQKWPNSFQDKVGGTIVGDGSTTLFNQIYSRICGMSGDTSLRLSPHDEKPSYAIEHYGWKNWIPTQSCQLTQEESNTTALEMKGWFEENPSVWNKDIEDMMSKTFYYQRTEIVKDKKPVKEVVSKWVFLKTEKGFGGHLRQVVDDDVDISALWEKNLLEMKEYFLKFLESELVRNKKVFKQISSSSKNKWIKIKAELINAKESSSSLRNEEALTEAVFVLLCLYFGENMDNFIKICKQTIPEELENAPLTPVILIIGQDVHDHQRSIILAVEKVEILRTKSLIKATLFLLGAYYVFGLVYPKDLSATLEYMQRRLLNITAEKKTSQKRQKLSISPTVVKLERSLNNLRTALDTPEDMSDE